MKPSRDVIGIVWRRKLHHLTMQPSVQRGEVIDAGKKNKQLVYSNDVARGPGIRLGNRWIAKTGPHILRVSGAFVLQLRVPSDNMDDMVVRRDTREVVVLASRHDGIISFRTLFRKVLQESGNLSERSGAWVKTPTTVPIGTHQRAQILKPLVSIPVRSSSFVGFVQRRCVYPTDKGEPLVGTISKDDEESENVVAAGLGGADLRDIGALKSLIRMRNNRCATVKEVELAGAG